MRSSVHFCTNGEHNIITGEENKTMWVTNTGLSAKEGSTFENKESAFLLVSKVDAETGDFLPDAVFELKSGNRTIAKFSIVRDSSGKASADILDGSLRGGSINVIPRGIAADGYEYAVITGLEEGKDYTIVEIQAPEGYSLADENTSFTFRDMTKIVIRDSGMSIHTTALSAETGDHITMADGKITIADTVAYEGLKSGKEYTLKGRVMYAGTEYGTEPPVILPAVRINGEPVTATKTFTPSASKGTAEMSFTFDASELKNKTVVIYEYLYSGDELLASHAYPDAESQMIYFPEIGTKAALVKDKVVDKVSYSNLYPGRDYIVKGWIVDVNGKKIVGSDGSEKIHIEPVPHQEELEEFYEYDGEESDDSGDGDDSSENEDNGQQEDEDIPEEKEPDVLDANGSLSKSGTVNVTLNIDTDQYKGQTVTVYEELYLVTDKGEFLLADHKELTDAKQQVKLPEIRTQAWDINTHDNLSLAGEGITITDTVTYRNLEPGHEYEIRGKLVNAADGDNHVIAESDVAKFVPDKSSGTVDIPFALGSVSVQDNTTLVVYEYLYDTETFITKHEERTDEKQRIHIPAIRTTANISDDCKVVTDEISYENILPDRDYVFRGWLVDTVTGEKVPESDGSVALPAAGSESGKVTMTLDAKGYNEMEGHKMTAFEELYVIEKIDGENKEIPVAEHKDTKDTDQTVEIYQDIRVSKNVTGNLGDLSKSFGFTVKFTGLEKNTEYTIEGDDPKTFTSDDEGNAEISFSLKDDQEITVKKLPKSAKYQVTEAASDHVASYEVKSEDMPEDAIIVKAEDTNGITSAKELVTELERVDQFDGTIVILWENNRDLATTTAVNTDPWIWVAALALTMIGATALIIRRRRFSLVMNEA